MPDVCATYTYAGVTINGDEDTDTLVITDNQEDGIDGLDGAPIRRQIDPVANDDGGDSQPAHFAHRIITFRGRCHIGTQRNRSPVGNTAYQSALVTLQKAVVAALEAQLNSNATLAWTEADGDARSISAKYGVPDGEIRFAGTVEDPTFSFSLVAEDPTIS